MVVDTPYLCTNGLPGGEAQPPPQEQWQGGGALLTLPFLQPPLHPSGPGLVPLEGRARRVSPPGPGVPGCGALGVLSLPGHLFAGLFPGWRQQKRSLKLEMDSRLGGRPSGGQSPCGQGSGAAPGARLGGAGVLRLSPDYEPAVARCWRLWTGTQLGQLGQDVGWESSQW